MGQNEDSIFRREVDKKSPEKLSTQANCMSHSASELSEVSNGIRPEKVVLGQKLVEDENYPSDDVLNKVVEEILGSEIADK